MATHFSILAWRIPRTEEPGGLQRVTKSHGVTKSWTQLSDYQVQESTYSRSTTPTKRNTQRSGYLSTASLISIASFVLSITGGISEATLCLHMSHLWQAGCLSVSHAPHTGPVRLFIMNEGTFWGSNFQTLPWPLPWPTSRLHACPWPLSESWEDKPRSGPPRPSSRVWRRNISYIFHQLVTCPSSCLVWSNANPLLTLQIEHLSSERPVCVHSHFPV